MQFQEPEDDYSFEGVKKTKTSTKIRIFILFLVFLLVIFIIIKNDFKLSFFSEDEKYDLGFKCSEENTLKDHDDDFLQKIKVKKAVKDNKKNFSHLDGFEGLEIAYKEKYNGSRIPYMKVFLNGDPESYKAFPEDVCNFDLKVEFN
ncbi:MAG: hypothetical protein R6V40_03440 [Candidatus Moraniibacteriota bacterium]